MIKQILIVGFLLFTSPVSWAGLIHPALTQDTVIDFEDTGPTGWYTHLIESNDFIFTKFGGWMGVNSYGSWMPTLSSYNGSKDLEMGYGHFFMAHQSWDLFNLKSMDAGLSWYNYADHKDLTLTGIQEENGLHQLITTDLTLSHDYQNFSLDGFDSLRGVIFSGAALNRGYVAIDNINVSPVSVPEPMMLPLMGIGLVGLMITRRQRTCT